MRARIAASLLCALWLAGCAGDGPPPVASGGAFDNIQTQIFNQHCLSAGCHNAQNVAGGLNLTTGVSYDNLVNVLSQNAVAQAQGLLRVEPFNTADSFLLIKVTMPALGEGGRMPLAMQELSTEEIGMITRWIANGAPRTGTPVPTGTPTVPLSTPTATATASVTPTASATPTPPSTATPSASVTGTAPATSTVTATASETPTPTASPTPSVTDTPSASFAVIQTTIFNATCATQFCHDSETKSGNLDLDEGVSYSQLINVVPDNENARNAGLLRVAPSDPDNSFLLIKVEGPTVPQQGGRMPLGQLKLSDADIALIRQWIAAGAPQ